MPHTGGHTSHTGRARMIVSSKGRETTLCWHSEYGRKEAGADRVQDSKHQVNERRGTRADRMLHRGLSSFCVTLPFRIW